MNKQTIVAAVLGLAMAGCANTRKAGPPQQPVAMTPIPSIHDTINRGENPAVANATLHDPANPNWAGRATPADAPSRGAAPRVAATTPNTAAAGASAVLTPGAPPAPFPQLAPEVVTRQTSAPPQVAASDPQVSPSSISGPTPGEPPASSSPGGVVDSPSFSPVANDLGMPDSAPIAGDANVAPQPAAVAPGLPDLSKPLEVEPYTPPLAGLPDVPPALAPKRPASAPSDPLLGPNPELMPSALDGPDAPEGDAPEAGAPAPAAEPPAPADVPAPAPAPAVEPTAPAPAPAPAVEPTAPAPAVEPSAPVELSAPPVEPSAPAGSIETSSLPELTPSPVSGGGVAPAADRELALASASTAPASDERPAPPRPTPRVDPQLRRASATRAADDQADDVIDPNWQRAGETAARVGDEVITMRELTIGVKDQLKKHNVKASQLPREEINMLAQNVLANLIDRSLIYQQARHELKDKKMTDLLEIADKVWLEEEVPPLLRINFVTTEQQLKLKMEESGRSLDALKLSHRRDFIAMLYIQQKLKDKLNVELPEMLKYYNAHVNDKSNFRAARITWREVVVETAKHADPGEARSKAEALLARLRRGEDFARLARAESEGPSAVKEQGGLMETSPGGYAVAAVNRAIETLPIGSVSDVIEGPSSLHIVRVEARRPAGPASFAELQDQIRREIYNEKSSRERRLLLDRLRENNIVSSIFDGTESDPNRVRR